jgi:hypothetical protein
LSLCNVERQIFAADLVVAPDEVVLEDAPKAFNCVGVHRTDNVLAGRVLDGFVVIFAQAYIALVLIGREQAKDVDGGSSPAMTEKAVRTI